MDGGLNRRSFLAATGATALAGCLGGPGAEAATSTPTAGSDGTIEAPTESSRGGPPTAGAPLPLPFDPADLRDRAVSGGPAKDGIPAIDDPSFVSADEVGDALDPGDPVFGLATDAGVKAYPQNILVWHEICNDTIGETPVSVTYCPLTGTAMGFRRGTTTFGVSGRLVNNNLIMYDRATETWWPQILATAIPGPWNEAPDTRSLQEFRLVWTTWKRWRSAHPGTQVLSRDTGFAKNYDRDPYGAFNPRSGYYAPEAVPIFPSLSDDDRRPPKHVVIAGRTTDGAVAFDKAALRDATLLEGHLAETPVVAVYDDTLDTGYVYRNPEAVSIEPRDGRFVASDGESYPPDGLPLERILAFDAMWFAWSGFYPGTTLHA